MREPPITITCDCGAVGNVPYGARWKCEQCGKTWNTSQIPQAEYNSLVAGVRRYRLLVVGPPLVLAAIMIPLAVLAGLQFAFLLFVLVMGTAFWSCHSSGGARRRRRAPGRRWKLSPE